MDAASAPWFPLSTPGRRKLRTSREVYKSSLWGFKTGRGSTMELKMKVTQSCPTLCHPTDYAVHGILQARILEWVAFPFSSESSHPRNQTGVSCIAGGFSINWAIREASMAMVLGHAKGDDEMWHSRGHEKLWGTSQPAEECGWSRGTQDAWQH